MMDVLEQAEYATYLIFNTNQIVHSLIFIIIAFNISNERFQNDWFHTYSNCNSNWLKLLKPMIGNIFSIKVLSSKKKHPSSIVNLWILSRVFFNASKSRKRRIKVDFPQNCLNTCNRIIRIFRCLLTIKLWYHIKTK